MAPRRNSHPRPRRHGGGRAEDYAERREGRGNVRQHAAEWSDAAAHAVFVALHEGSRRRGESIGRYTEKALTEAADAPEQFGSHECRGVCARDRALIADILACHASRLEAAGGRAARVRRVRSFLKPLRERAKARGAVSWLDVAPRTPRPMQGTFHQWLAERPEAERQRDLPAEGPSLCRHRCPAARRSAWCAPGAWQRPVRGQMIAPWRARSARLR
mmetsp:Transcript_35657/g.88712  ORF Transcript_35657/g.88712 Transcript_35657/m.88712 type:complete len:217 (+) Transcript_35657:316-966(+)